MASLFVIRGRDQGRHFTLRAGIHRIGREPTNTVQLLDSETSRAHAEIRSTDGSEFELIDLASSNGTFVNDQAVQRHTLRSGDRLQIGQTLMIFTGASQPAALAAARGVQVDIVQQSRTAEASRIVSSFSQSLQRPEAAAEQGQVTGDRSLEVMYLTALAVGRTTEIPELLDRVLRLVFDWVEADRGCIMLRDQQSQILRPAARCDRKEKVDAERMAISRTILDYVIDRKEGVRTSDALDDRRWDAAQSIVQAGIREAMCVPLQGRYGVVGAMYVDTFTSPGSYVAGGQMGRFTDQHLRLMTAIGYQAALAIEDTFYYSALVQSERLAVMGQTIANLSHHIKNILQGIRGGSYLIEAGLSREDPDAVRRGWTIVEKNQERISNLVMDMLTYSKERHPERVQASLNATVAEVVELMQNRASEVGCQLMFHPDTEAPPAFFDPEALHRAILNIVTNAIDAATESDSPIVQVRTGFDPQQGWRIEVVDSGPGIPPGDRERIFSPFESGKGARGTGLGLPVSKKIMSEHGGAIETEEVQPHGTLFRLLLPPAIGDDADQRSLESRDTLA